MRRGVRAAAGHGAPEIAPGVIRPRSASQKPALRFEEAFTISSTPEEFPMPALGDNVSPQGDMASP